MSFVCPTSDPERTAEELPACSEDGVDLTLIRWMLSLTPAERLEVLRQFANFILSVRAANPQL